LNDLDSVLQKARRIRRVVDRRIAEARLIATNGKKLKEEISLASHDVDLYNKVAITLASIGETRQARAQETIEELVTRGLNAIFDDDLSFQVVQTQRGKTPEVKFLVKSSMANGRAVETSVMDARGGGLAAVVGFLLRLVVLLLNKDNKDSVLILDESFSHVSAEYERPLAEFIKELIEKTKVQIILVTHSDAFSEFADKRYRFRQPNGLTKVDEL
jgi:DNA repair exonuclease SbcCD ATPase subunit